MATQQDVADHLGITQPAVAGLVRVGAIPASARGGYDIEACRLAYLHHLRESAAGRDSSRPGSLEAERARLAKEQADKVAMENAKARGEMVELAPLSSAMCQVIESTRAQLERVPAIVAGADHKLRARIARAIHDALEEMAMRRVVEISGQSIEDDEDAGLGDALPVAGPAVRRSPKR